LVYRDLLYSDTGAGDWIATELAISPLMTFLFYHNVDIVKHCFPSPSSPLGFTVRIAKKAQHGKGPGLTLPITIKLPKRSPNRDEPVSERQRAVRDCEHSSCPLHYLRMGRGGRATLRRIRSYCLWCCIGQRSEVRQCPSLTCSLWEYRFGRRPQKSSSLPKIFTTEGVWK
jgi:hypothetical protein